MKNVLIVGAQFANKGAESMLYITVDEIKKRYPDANIFFGTTEEFDENEYTFRRLYYSPRAKEIALGGVKSVFRLFESIVWDFVKFFIGKKDSIGHYFDVKNVIEDIDMIIDVSGFSIGEKWSKSAHIEYIKNIKLGQKYGIPMYLMPQSFGPFNYNQDMKKIKSELAKYLEYPKLIFAREQQGFDDLLSIFNLHNVVLSTDLVLQNKGIDLKNIFNREITIDVPVMPQGRFVGIMPNKQCFNHGNSDNILRIYHEIIKKLIQDGYSIVLFRHSKEDLEICKRIKQDYSENNQVILVEREFSCIEYDKYVQQFEFIVGSRFHGLVHAYRNCIPCISLGWAIKYLELAKCLEQEKYAFDIIEKGNCIEEILDAIESLENNIALEKEIISENLINIQKNNCFLKIFNQVENVNE